MEQTLQVRRVARTKRNAVIGALFLLLLVLAGVVCQSIFESKASFSFMGATCVERFTLLPGLYRSEAKDYRLEYRDPVRFAGIDVAGSHLCAVPVASPKANSQSILSMNFLGLPFVLQKKVRVSVASLPSVSEDVFRKGIPVTKPLAFSTRPDEVFDYKVSVADKVVDCKDTDPAKHLCDIQKLSLEQGKTYGVSVQRYFKGKSAGVALDTTIETLNPVSVTATSIKPSEVIWSKPTTVALELDKKLTRATATLEKKEQGKYTPVPSTQALASNKLTLTFGELPRKTEYRVVLKDTVAEDGSVLHGGTFELPFSTSGGPKVTNVNIGRKGITPGTTVVVTFDQALSPTQDITSLTKLQGLSAPTKQGNTLKFAINAAPCAELSIALTAAIQNEHGVAGDSAWSFASQMQCQTVFSIGTSAQGKPITGYKFGNGPNHILFVGMTHGDEKSSAALLKAWVGELEARGREVPADKTVVVIPVLNPDGEAASSRRNGRGIDLNRNFPTKDWKADVVVPGGELVKNGGGATALSEPESQAIASYTQSIRPYLALTYHAFGGLVTPNEAGNSSSYAQTYLRHTGYRLSPKSEVSTVFRHDTTGAYEDWLYEKPGIATLLIEMSSMTNPQTAKHFPAMWAMVK